MQFNDLKAQYQRLKINIDRRIQGVLDHGQYIMGPEVIELEDKLADYVGVKHVISCANGTDALLLSLKCLDLKVGDAVFCPTFTFFATAEAIVSIGATPVFVDSDKHTFNICPIDLEVKIKQTLSAGKLTPRAIIAVDLFGLPANYPLISQIANRYSLKLIEDAAQGFGGEILSAKAGSFGDLATTSFFPAKPLGCYGDGGAIFTNNDEYAELIRSLRNHGKGVDKYDNVRIGMNSRLDTIQAAILLEKLKVFPDEVHRRNEIATLYDGLLESTFSTPTIPEDFKSSWAQYTVMNNNREMLINKLKQANIPCMIYYRTCMHQQSLFNHMESNCPNGESHAAQVLSLPMHPYMSDEQVERIANELLNSLSIV